MSAVDKYECSMTGSMVCVDAFAPRRSLPRFAKTNLLVKYLLGSSKLNTRGLHATVTRDHAYVRLLNLLACTYRPRFARVPGPRFSCSPSKRWREVACGWFCTDRLQDHVRSEHLVLPYVRACGPGRGVSGEVCAVPRGDTKHLRVGEAHRAGRLRDVGMQKCCVEVRDVSWEGLSTTVFGEVRCGLPEARWGSGKLLA